ncbi:MAG TPA: serine/threonine-protein kinase, partial [Isosphaeraceae bacterium]|nr:serine/threonine-protein kinase [Isosphaeraceae bacterium]
MTHPQACPDESTLRDFLQDQLAGADAQRIDDHLGGCPACQRVLDRLVGSLPGPWLPDPAGAEGDAPQTHTVTRSLGVRLRDPTDDPSAADTKSDPAAGDPQAAVGRPAPRTGESDPRGNDALAAGGEADSHALFPPERPRTIGRYRVIRPLGRGGFGRVYLAQDDDLDRRVAIKVPNPERMARPADIASFLAEGRILARLDHPHIVPVFDAGRTEAGVGFVVSKLIEGSDLATRIGQGRLSFREAAELIATLAEALHYAHTHGLVHRDVKPANILIDRTGRAYLADFGLALKDEDIGKGTGFAGTPAYMSPEQARGEGHRVDGRSDLFSLGLVLYELLTGRRAFRGDSWRTVLDQIIKAEVRPPRQVDDAIPPELERICLKAVSKRAAERYTTGRDLAEDLRHFLQAEAAGFTPSAPVPVSPPPGSTQEATAVPARRRLDSDPQTVEIVPKGLRSFDQHDADFFLELLPGPRDRDGLPESLRFWKTRIESTDPDRTFRVGLIYGPSGCGKTSLVQAGLLPRLGKHVLPVSIEATAGETEPRLLRGLRRVCPEVDAQMELVAAAAAVRRGHVLPSGAKVLLVLDQFEQWLFARRGEADTELIATLRQCDGARVQAIVLVRDDFWLAASRFMRDLEIRLVEGENSALVDLFDPLHARKVLGAFGRAYGVLPARPADLTPEQQAFLDQAVAGLAQDGKIISVRLALFAEMVKGKPWTPASLRQVGGTEGVGVTFLEETFSAATAPPEHRLHQNAAQAVLKALLPPSGTDIKGQMRSESELRAASGYASRPRDFEDLVRILDPELRLITPTDPEGAPDVGQAVRPAGQRYYQLTHDYLVHALRDWLTRKQRETRRGRAELRLADRAALWNAKPENRHLPSVLEWASIRVLTRKREWTEPQQRMMERARRVHGLRAMGLAAVAVALILLGRDVRRRIDEANRATFASSLVQQALHVGTAQVPEVVQALGDYRRWADPALKRVLAETSDPKEKLHASLALLPVDAGQVAYLEQRLLDAELGELPVVRAALQPHQSRLTPKLWSVLDAARPGDPHLLRSAAALALYDPEDPRWAGLGSKVAGALVTEN